MLLVDDEATGRGERWRSRRWSAGASPFSEASDPELPAWPSCEDIILEVVISGSTICRGTMGSICCPRVWPRATTLRSLIVSGKGGGGRSSRGHEGGGLRLSPEAGRFFDASRDRCSCGRSSASTPAVNCCDLRRELGELGKRAQPAGLTPSHCGRCASSSHGWARPTPRRSSSSRTGTGKELVASGAGERQFAGRVPLRLPSIVRRFPGTLARIGVLRTREGRLHRSGRAPARGF